MSQMTQVLTPGEKILWEDKPQFLPFILSSLPIFLIGSVFLAVGLVPLAMEGSTAGLIHAAIGAIVGPGSLIYTVLVHRFVHYVITDKRVIIQGGLIGRDYTGIEHDQITSTQVSVGLADKLVGRNSGSVMITHAGGRVSKNGSPRPTGLKSVTDPYKVYQLLNQISHNVRTDIQYPNAMRPDTNPGYGTEYKK